MSRGINQKNSAEESYEQGKKGITFMVPPN